MINLWKTKRYDFAVIICAVLLFFGCIASSIRSAKTVEPQTLSVSVSYIRGMNAEKLSDEPLHYVPLELRYGVAKGVDVGVQHTLDLTRDLDNKGNTLWLDGKFQVMNRNNEIGKPIFSLGLMKGFFYNMEVTQDIWSLPFMMSYPLEGPVTPTLMYRYELISDSFFPDERSWKSPRHSITGGIEIDLTRPTPGKSTPKIGVGVSWYNSYLGGEGPDGLALSVGFIF